MGRSGRRLMSRKRLSWAPHPAGVRPALAELELMFPSSQGFHDGTDPRRARFLGDEFAGIDSFPFASTETSRLAVHDLVTRLVETLLEADDLRIYSAETWAKYTGARLGGTRYTMHLNYRRAECEWAQRHAWADRSHEPEWYRFVGRATPGSIMSEGRHEGASDGSELPPANPA
jgi:hypothetical protein